MYYAWCYYLDPSLLIYTSTHWYTHKHKCIFRQIVRWILEIHFIWWQADSWQLCHTITTLLQSALNWIARREEIQMEWKPTFIFNHFQQKWINKWSPIGNWVVFLPPSAPSRFGTINFHINWKIWNTFLKRSPHCKH